MLWSTYPTMMNLIDGKADEKRKFGPAISISSSSTRRIAQSTSATGPRSASIAASWTVGNSAARKAKFDIDAKGLSQDAEIASRFARRALGYDVSGKLTTSRTRPCRAFAPDAWRERKA